jgi:uncharacterized protein (DUF58 family)
LEREITVLPPVDATDDLMESLPIILGEFESFLSGRGHDLYRIREYSPGDPARHIDWKSSAKASSMMVREFAREDERSLRIVFDNPPSGALTEWEYERGINLAASLAWHFANESVSLSFLAPGYDGSERVLDFLKYLALSRPGGKPLSLAEIPVTSANNLMLTGRAPGSIPEPIWASSYVVFLRVKNNEAR